MEWNVYVEDCNTRKIKVYNIFNHYKLVEDFQKIYKKFKNDKEVFLDEIRKSLMYYFWCKCEWEIILSDWPPSETFNKEKIDVYSQIMLNWHVFSEYVWENRDEFKKKKTK